MDVVKEVWETVTQGNLMWILPNKLKNIAKALANWSKNTIGDVFEIVRQMEDIVRIRVKEYDRDDSDSNRISLYKAQADYIKWLKMQEDILRQKARVKCVKEGDTNSRYFYSIIKGRRRNGQIFRIKDYNGRWMTNSEQIAQDANDYFSSILS